MPTGVYTRTARRQSTTKVTATAKDTAPVTSPTTDALKEPAKLTGPLVRAVDTLRTVFTSFVSDFAALEVRREELAPRFMRTFGKWQSETGGTFIAFVRVLVADVPMTVKEYKLNRAYMAADYLRRLAQQQDRATASPVERAKQIAARPASPRLAMARMMASFLPLIDPAALDALRAAMETQLHWSTAQVNGIMDLVGKEQPIVRVRAPRGVHMEEHSLRLVAAPTPRAIETDGEELARTGTNG